VGDVGHLVEPGGAAFASRLERYVSERPQPRLSRHSPGLLGDILAPKLTVVFCGINPAVTAIRSGRHFSSATNRFWCVLHRTGFTSWQIRPEEGRSLLVHRCGLTVAAARATQKVADLTRQELREGQPALEQKVRHCAPQVIAFLGKAAYAAMTDDRRLAWGRQRDLFAGAVAWILPNPSGRNRLFRTEDLVRAYRELRDYVEPSDAAAEETDSQASGVSAPADLGARTCSGYHHTRR
jgi:TDG/mug DNA glycosylase family protein